MREFVQVAGVRRWHGDEFVRLQKDALDALQGVFASYAPCILSGLVLTSTGVTYPGGSYGWNVSAGFAAIQHADGVKIVQWAGGVYNFSGSVSTPIYLTITKTTNTKAYNDGLTHNASVDYVATFTTALPAVPGTYITLNDTANPAYTFPEAMGRALRGAWVTFPLTTGVQLTGGSLKYRINKFTGRLELKGTITVGTPSSFPALYYNGGNLPVVLTENLPFTCYYRYSSSTLKEAGITDMPLRTCNAEIRTDGQIAFGLIREATATAYTLSINASFPLD